MQQLTGRKEDLERQLSDRLPEFRRQLTLANRPVSDLEERLPEGAVFVDVLQYMDFQNDPEDASRAGRRDKPSYVAFVLRRGTDAATVFLGPAAPIDQAVADWRADIQTGRTSPAAATLRALVWEKLEPHFPAGTTTVLISPDGSLTRLPWVALPGRQAGTVLLEDYALAIVPHGLFLLDRLTADPKPAPAGGELLAVGDVRYDQAPPVPTSSAETIALHSTATRGDRSGVWGVLKGTRAELDAIAALAGNRPVHPLSGTEASTAAVLAALPKARWAHLATHGFFADPEFRSHLQLDEKQFQPDMGRDRAAAGSRSPLVLSGLVLAGANLPRPKDSFGIPRGDGGILTAEAIAGLDLRDLELVVLSACDTGLGEVAGGEGVFGLQRAFHTAGAQNVVASLWKVNDEATAALMKLFYHKLWTEAKPPIVALREAQLDLYRHPERIKDLAAARGPDFTKQVTIIEQPRPQSKPSDRAPAKLWAGFVLSGMGGAP